MRRLSHFLLLLFVGSLFLGVDAMSQDQSLTERFRKLTDDFVKQSLVLSPVSATAAGYHKHVDPKTGATLLLDEMLDDVSAEGLARQRQFYEGFRKRLRAEVPREKLSAEDRADYDLIETNISLSLLDLDRIQPQTHNPTVYVELVGNALFQPLVLEYAPLETRLGHILARMEKLPRLLAQARQNLVDSAPIYTQTAIEENNGTIDLVEHAIREAMPASGHLAERYRQLAPATVAALREFNEFLEKDLAKRGTHSWRLGNELYGERLRYALASGLTSEEILASAEQGLARVRKEMLEAALPMHKEYYPAHSDHSDLAPAERTNRIVKEVLDAIAREHPDRDNLMNQAQQDLDEIKKFIREKDILALSGRENLQVIPTPVFMRGVYGVAGFASAPPLEPQLGAFYWVTPIPKEWPPERAEAKLREYNNYKLLLLTIHEAMPGHYIQFEHANSVQPASRRVLRALFGNGPYIEGWAQYIEDVMIERGFRNHSPKLLLNYQKEQLRLYANAILDVRLHTMNMTDEEALTLMERDTFQEKPEAEAKLQRAKLTYNQLPTYFVGLREWLRLRKDCAAALGDKFSLREFHNRALDEGPVPLPTLRGLLLPGSRGSELAHARSN